MKSIAKKLNCKRTKKIKRTKKPICAITHLTIPKKIPVFTFVRPNNSMVYFNSKELVKYINKTGNLKDPESQLDFSNEDIKRLNELTGSNIKRHKSQELFRQNSSDLDLKFGLERIIGETIAKCKDLIERSMNESERERYEEEFLNEYLPEFMQNFDQLKIIDKKFASQSLKQYLIFLKGDPRHRIPNDQYMYQFIKYSLKRFS